LIDGAAFYLIINLSAGGTSGWFPDGVGDKPWYDTSSSKFATRSFLGWTYFPDSSRVAAAKFDFAMAQDTWASTWPSDIDQRSFRM